MTSAVFDAPCTHWLFHRTLYEAQTLKMMRDFACSELLRYQ